MEAIDNKVDTDNYSTVEFDDTIIFRDNKNSVVEFKERVSDDRFSLLTAYLKEARKRSEVKMNLKKLSEYEVGKAD